MSLNVSALQSNVCKSSQGKLKESGVQESGVCVVVLPQAHSVKVKKGLDVLFRLRYGFSTPLGKGVSLARHLHQPGESRSTSKGF